MATKKTGGSHRSSVEQQEERVWVGFYRRVRDPVIAMEVKAVLDDDPRCKESHMGLYLQCQYSLRLAKKRRARIALLHSGLRAVGRWLALPFRFAGSSIRFVGDVVLPVREEADDMASQAVQRLGKQHSTSGQKDKQVHRRAAVQSQTNASDARQDAPESDGLAQAAVK